MTTTPDTALAARLAEPQTLQTAHHSLINAYRSGQLITLADHLEAVQAAVAKAAEVEREACARLADLSAQSFVTAAPKISADLGIDQMYRGLSAAIRARKGDAL